MRPRPEHEGWRWLHEARNDLAGSGHLRQGGFHSLACFHAHQAAEKAAKAFLYAQGAEEIWGHSAADLLKECGTYDSRLTSLYEVGAGLDRYYIPSRYPNGLPGGLPMEAFQQEDAGRAGEQAERILASIEQLMPAEPKGLTGRMGDASP